MAEVDYFLYVEGIKGESQDAVHKEQIQIESFKWEASQKSSATTNLTSGAGKVSMGDLILSMKTNKATVPLLNACATGQRIAKAALYCRKAGKGQQDYLCITLEAVYVSNYTLSGDKTQVIPIDQFSLNYGKIEWIYHEQKADGSLAASNKKGYDLKKQQPL